jgi:hypothetical protein
MSWKAPVIAFTLIQSGLVMKQKRFFGSSNSKNGSADSMLNHGGPITIFSLRTQDCRRLVSEGEKMMLHIGAPHANGYCALTVVEVHQIPKKFEKYAR